MNCKHLFLTGGYTWYKPEFVNFGGQYFCSTVLGYANPSAFLNFP
jgi:hypothetical protein